MKAIYFSSVKTAGPGVVVFFPLHRHSDTGGSGARAENQNTTTAYSAWQDEAGGKQTLQPIARLKVNGKCCYLGCGDEC